VVIPVIPTTLVAPTALKFDLDRAENRFADDAAFLPARHVAICLAWRNATHQSRPSSLNAP
jgi:hypothetical protein